MEILSPAGSPESLIAAVRAGADAVYLGTPDFNARRNARNFTEESLNNAIEYCKIRGVRVYLTLNTLIYDREIPLLKETIKKAAENSVDALIVADLGVAEIVKKCCPAMPLFASTQMTVHNIQGVKKLAELGFKRVILARENSKDEIKKITKAAAEIGIETEIFVHGAHCMSISGLCQISAVLGGRSGNRGLCAGTCRLPFSVYGNNKNAYDLSLIDLCLLKHVNEIKNLGVSSIKIEGRMKGEEYTALSTYLYKKAANGENIDENEINLLQKIFSRNGFTDGYYKNEINGDMFGYRNEKDEQNTKNTLSTVHEIYRKERQNIPVDFHFDSPVDKPMTLTISDGNNTVITTGNIPEKAQNPRNSEKQIRQNLSKCGGTPYFANNINVNTNENLYITASEINNLRRNALDELSEKRKIRKAIPYTSLRALAKQSSPSLTSLDCRTSFAMTVKTYISILDINQIPKNTSEIDLIFVPLNTDFEKTNIPPQKLALYTPPAIFKNIEKQLKSAAEHGIKYAIANNIGTIDIIKNAGLKLIGGTHLNIFGSIASEEYFNIGVKKQILSTELPDTAVNNIKSQAEKGVFVYGRMPLMVFRACPTKAKFGCKNCTGKITDRMDIEFPISCKSGVSTLYNSVPVWYGDRLNEINADIHYFSFYDETAEEIEEILKKYKNKQKSSKPYTRGLLPKGVI